MRKLILFVPLFLVMYATYDTWTQIPVMILDIIARVSGAYPEATGLFAVVLVCVMVFFIIRWFIRKLLSLRADKRERSVGHGADVELSTNTDQVTHL